MKKGNVYLVGAGCGDPGLLTIRAAQLLQSCEVVLYDSLVQEELLQSVSDECEKIYVGSATVVTHENSMKSIGY